MRKIIFLVTLLLSTLANAGDATIKLPSNNGADAFVVQDKYATPLMSVDSYGDTTVKNLSVSDPSSVGNIHLFLVGEVVNLWVANAGIAGGPYTKDVSANVPSSAKGVVIMVNVNAHGRASGSFMVADRRGNFGSHGFSNGFINYTNTWVGGTVFVPFIIGTKTFKWQMASNIATPDNVVSSNAALIGWF